MSTKYKVGSLLAYFGNDSAPFKNIDFEKDLNNHDKKVKRALSGWERNVNDNSASPEKKKKKSGNGQDGPECNSDYNNSTLFKRQKNERNRGKDQYNDHDSKAEYKKSPPFRKRKKHGKDQDEGREIKTECFEFSPASKQKKKNSNNQDEGHENKIDCKESATSRKHKKERVEDHDNEEDNKTESNNPPLPRKQKKKHHKGNNSEQDSVAYNNSDLGALPMDRKIKDDPEKLARTLFVGNLPPTMKSKKLIRLFKRFGKIQSVRFRSAFTVVGRNFKLEDKEANHVSKPERRFCAYVVMDNIENISEALQLNGSEIEGHIIRVDSAQNTNHDHKKSVFVANLPYNALEDEVRAFFCECGKILNVRIIRDPVHGAGKGIGYVLFDSEDGVMLALQKNGQDFNGRMLRVQPAKSDKTLKKNKRESVALTSPQWHSKKSKPHYYKNFNYGGLESEQGRKAKRKILRQIRHPRISNKAKNSNQQTADQW